MKVMDMGVIPQDIIYANPAKPRSHIVAAAELGVQTVTFDSETELHKLKRYLPGARLDPLKSTQNVLFLQENISRPRYPF